MKRIVLSLMMLLTVNAFAQTVEQATELYSKRGTDFNFALQSAQMFETLAANTTDKLVKAKMLNSAANSYYYVGTQVETNLDKKKFFQKGINISIKAIRYVFNLLFIFYFS